MKKYTVMVINNVFEERNVIMIHSPGYEYINRFDEYITPEMLEDIIYHRDIKVEECEIHVVSKDWRGNTKVETF